MSLRETFLSRGWVVFEPDPRVEAWAAAAWRAVGSTAGDPAQADRCGGTWFAGVGALGNGADGAPPIPGAPPLSGPAVSFLERGADADGLGFGPLVWDAAQISVCHRGYPQPQPGESAAATRYRRARCGAHVDGLQRRPDTGRRHFSERHGFILGVPLTEGGAGRAPMVVWEGSHMVMRAALAEAARAAGPAGRPWEADVTDAVAGARRTCFDRGAPKPLTVPVGGAYVVHRLALHGVARWEDPHDAEPRAVAYFRPDPFGPDPERALAAWLGDP